MSIYNKRRINYRKIYENYFGKIPIDLEGRRYDIHHIDGNINNNDISNLKSVSLQEHYDIHYQQGDWAACNAISMRMKISSEEKSKIARDAANRQVAEGRHNFLGGKIQSNTQKRRFNENNHNFQDNSPHRPSSEDLSNWMREIRKNEKNNGIVRPTNSEFMKKQNLRRLESGEHQNLKTHTCPHCGKVGKSPSMFGWHFDNCKNKLL